MADRYIFPEEEIKRRCANWNEIIFHATGLVFVEGDPINTNLDESDINYIEILMEQNPKLRRLMPDIIYETMTFGDNEFIR
tara:strand:+ start:188 stop:430 length:243 start_codon:yes stop_codon:yes gene_type:complete